MRVNLRPRRHTPLHPCQGRVLSVLKILLLLAVVLPILWEIKILTVGLLSGQTNAQTFLKWVLIWLVSLPLVAYLPHRPVEKFIQSVYTVPEGQGRSLLRNTRQPLYPKITIGEGGSYTTVMGNEATVSHIGGPGQLSLYNDTAAVLERAGQFSRVVCGPTSVYLERFERLYQAVDLRPQHGSVLVKAMSKEGIPVTCRVEIEFQIAWRDASPTEEDPYPASPDAVFDAVISTQVRHPANHTVNTRDWVERVVKGSIGETLRTLLAQKRLDHLVPAQIVPPEPKSEQKPEPKSIPKDAPQESIDHHRELQEELSHRLTSQLASLGVKLTRVHLGNIDVDESVSAQWADIWRAGWRKWATELLGKGRAERLQNLDEIRAETQVEFLNAVADEIRILGNNSIPISDSLIALQFIDALRQMAPLRQQDKLQFPGQAWNALEQLRRIIVRRDDDPEVHLRM